ncbi:hypothetical protein O8E88_002229 [Flavobacterium psychrophilum]|jgi:hypothetical protein|uniref:Uncharacterized protein n=1 Tax=Flavobacterium psychrophilum TaxID=96345 RepID=A0A8G2FZ21_FLAPS|nr:hypothetical protein [Flavobacterium psychrophilum]EKT2070402.1 hypothetical protein [Flavobacterium psychrophilum]EKT2072762.1 hypothetical protein [Flavobacterium psychrophilum]EKT4492215.1 hypothetical protein [Flavobacterium psychrophilum]EKT4499976.1 hypothetical protein [Flavobacterium psychrophilum]EKT4550686.1 hypothetical protein [Flavobacterium psychrophilum]
MYTFNKIKTSEQASLCHNNNCVTVYGETAKFVNSVVAVATVSIALILIIRALK